MSAKLRSDFPRQVKVIETCFIPLSDGIKLAAKIWLPEDAEANPVPALLEYLPYRKGDHMAQRDQPMHHYFAGFGYASLRVDMRGSGDSEGILLDEYSKQEHDDALEIMNWLEQQPWCSGTVGMFGISWGGFNALQVAARRPKQLRAIITLCSTDDRYGNDVHYTGGCLNACDALAWGGFMHMAQARPPDPQVLGENWQKVWLERLKRTPNYLEAWLSHQRRDDYWKHGSVCEDYRQIECAVYSIQGWADGYVTSTPRLLAGLTCPKKALIGPWAHTFPHNGKPGPQMGFLQEALRWWDYWLKGIDTGIMNGPLLRVWMQESVAPAAYHAERPGRWVAEEAWPSSRIVSSQLFLAREGLQLEPGDGSRLAIKSSQLHGLAAGIWCPYGNHGDFPADQRRDDALALTFDSAPLEQPEEILGYPELNLQLSADQPLALVSARLCDVAPTGESLLVTRGALNLTHHKSHEYPEWLEPGKRYTVHIELDAIAHRLPAGHRWRIAISPTYWTHLWPSPKPVTLTVYCSESSSLALPIRPTRADDADLCAFEQAEAGPKLEAETLRKGNIKREHHYDALTQTHTFIDAIDEGETLLKHNGLSMSGTIRNLYRIREGEPLSAFERTENTAALKRGNWQVRVVSVNTLSSTETEFFLTSQLEAFEGETQIFSKLTEKRIARDFM